MFARVAVNILAVGTMGRLMVLGSQTTLNKNAYRGLTSVSTHRGTPVISSAAPRLAGSRLPTRRGEVRCYTKTDLAPQFLTEKEQSRKYKRNVCLPAGFKRMLSSFLPSASDRASLERHLLPGPEAYTLLLEALKSALSRAISWIQVFAFDEWAKHRSTARYWRHIASMFQ